MEDVQVTLALAVCAGFVAILMAGATNRVVIYYDIKDFVVSFMPWGTMIAAFILLNIYQHEGDLDLSNLSGTQTIIWYGAILLSAGFFIWAMRLSIRHNRSVAIGLVTGLFKVLSALLAVVVIVGKIGDIFSDKSSAKDSVGAMIVLGIFIWLGHKLINGEEVYIAKGWELPHAGKISA